MERLTGELQDIAAERNIELATDSVDDVLIYAMFPQVGLKFLENRGNPGAFEPAPWQIEETPAIAAESAAPAAAPIADGPEAYRVEVNGKTYDVVVSPQGHVQQATTTAPAPALTAAPAAEGRMITAPLAGNIVRVGVRPGQAVAAGEVVLVLEAMKMETEVRAPAAGTVTEVRVKEGDAVSLGAPLLALG
jgi:oxaloacetate decarboxylase alpha subunit